MSQNINTNVATYTYGKNVVTGFRVAGAPMRDIFMMDASDLAAQRGQTIRILGISSGSAVQAFSDSTGFQVQAFSKRGIDITLSNYYYTTNALNQQEIFDSSLLSLEQNAAINATELANTVFYDNLNYLSSSNSFATCSVSGSTASSYTANMLTDIRTEVVSNYKWTGPAYLVVNSRVFGALQKDSALEANTRGSSDVQQGQNLFRRINNVRGWNAIIEAPDIPFTDNTVGYAVTPRALVVAMRYWAPPKGGVYLAEQPLVDDVTGITLGYREYVNESMDRTDATVTALWGKAVGDPKSAVRLKAVANT